MEYVIIWWVIIQIIGWAAMPLAFRLFRYLPDRGYALAKPLGLLLVTYLFWLLCTLGLLQNTWGSIFFCLVAVAAVGGYLYLRERGTTSDESLTGFLRAHWQAVVASEVLFLAGFALWSLYRAYNPAISATEKPMEFAFLNGILRSDHFPPLDPWLSGYGISYYYFGYVMMAVLTRLSGIASSFTFNLGIALLFAWTLTGAFSLVYNLVQGFRPARSDAPAERGLARVAIGFGLLGAWAVTIAGNLEGFLEALHTRGLGSLAFWNWLDIKDLAAAPITGGWYPTDNWWWWRASRVIHDKDPLGRSIEVIDEFPFFSFLLGDMHPHVLALPFVLLALGLALNLVFAARHALHAPAAEGRLGWLRTLFGEPAWVFLAYGLCIGALGFLNTWDLPIYFAIVIGAFAIRRRQEGTSLDWLGDTVKVALLLGLLALVLYVPFYIAFQSQANGILPELLVTTRWQQYLVMFGLPLFMLGGLLVARWAALWRSWENAGERLRAVRHTIYLWLGLYIVPTMGMLLVLMPLFLTARGRDFLESIRNNEAVRQVIGDLPWNQLLVRFLMRRLADPWTAVLVALFLALGAILLLRGLGQPRGAGADAEEEPPPDPRGPADLSSTFALWIALIGLSLTFAVEFVYLRDTFGTRMNTVFKFYYQGWALLSLAGVYGTFYVLRDRFLPGEAARPRGPWRVAWGIGLVLLFAMTAVYPVLAAYNKADGFQGRPTLDGTAFMAQYSPDDHAAIEWLNQNVSGAPVILEATGGSYSQYGRVSGQTGLPTVLGWGGHELQWRGNYDEAGKREPDIDQIYNSFDPKLTLTLLDKYGISYVYVGSLEREKYSAVALSKFDRLLDTVYRNGTVTIYKRRR